MARQLLAVNKGLSVMVRTALAVLELSLLLAELMNVTSKIVFKEGRDCEAEDVEINLMACSEKKGKGFSKEMLGTRENWYQ